MKNEGDTQFWIEEALSNGKYRLRKSQEKGVDVIDKEFSEDDI